MSDNFICIILRKTYWRRADSSSSLISLLSAVLLWSWSSSFTCYTKLVGNRVSFDHWSVSSYELLRDTRVLHTTVVRSSERDHWTCLWVCDVSLTQKLSSSSSNSNIQSFSSAFYTFGRTKNITTLSFFSILNWLGLYNFEIVDWEAYYMLYLDLRNFSFHSTLFLGSELDLWNYWKEEKKVEIEFWKFNQTNR